MKRREITPISSLRASLVARRAELAQVVADAKRTLAAAAEEQKHVDALLKMKEPARAPFSPETPPAPSIGRIVARELLDHPSAKADLNNVAIEAGYAAPARAVHAILMNLKRHKHIESNGDFFVVTKTGQEALERTLNE